MPTAPRALTRLCLEFDESSLEKPQEANDFLQRHREPLGLEGGEGSLLSRFQARVWPEGVPTTLIASNISFDRNHPRWLLRPVSWGPEAAGHAAAHQTLGMEVFRKQSRLVVKRFEVTPHLPPRNHELVLSAPLFWNPGNLWMLPEELDALGRLPFHREETRQRLEGWRKYLQWQEERVRKLQLKVPYLDWKWLDAQHLAFLVSYPLQVPRRLEGQELGAQPVQEENPAEQARGSRRREADPVGLGEVVRVSPLRPHEEGVRKLWADALEDVESPGQVVIQPEEELAERFQRRPELIPARGVLVSAIAGDLAPLLNQVQAINRLQNSQGFCPRLGDFLFSATSASLPASPPPELTPLPGTRPLNPGQLEAVTKALAAPDLCLIQGPPGTGKTTVIAELCLRVTADGGRVLVASQTNLAVDNALSRLADRPHIRRLRLGNAERVDEDYQDFLADKVVDRWFSTISDACTERIEETARLEQELTRARKLLDGLRGALKAHDEARAALQPLQEQLQAAEREREALSRQAHEARERKDGALRQAEVLRALRAWADGTEEPPSVPSGMELPELAALLLDVRARLSPEDPVGRLEGVALLATVLGRGPDLDTLRGLLLEGRSRCEGGASGGTSAELAGLLAERQRLSLSEDEAEASRVAALNRKIRGLQSEEWSGFTRQLGLIASRLWGVSTPRSVQTLIETLRPAGDLVPSFDALTRLIEQASEARDCVVQARPGLSRAFGTRGEQARALEAEAEHAVRETEAGLTRFETRREALRERRQTLHQEVDAARARWDEAWRDLHPTEVPPAPAFQDFARVDERQRAADRDTEHQLERRRRWSGIQQEWRLRLARATESDREHLKSLYVRHANVVGMTCNEAGKKATYQNPAFEPFTMVIIDEVSKATPTELIMPMLLGRKVVLVGDHRQLPPMFREREASFAEAQAEGDIDLETFQKYQRMVTASLFQELFEAAPAALKSMLWVQYRMHPQVMDAVNQFYGGKLQPGAPRGEAHARQWLADRRQHHLSIPDGRGGRLLEPHQHLLWVDSSHDGKRPHLEEQLGTSKLNRLEVDLVLQTLRQLNVALYERGYGGNHELRAGRQHSGWTVRDFIRRQLEHLPEPTLDDLFEEKRIRMEGRSQKPGRLLRDGDVLHVHAQRQVGVLTFYGAQHKALREAIDRERDNLDAMELRTNTVDRFQGMERPIIIASLVRAVKKGALGEFVRQFQRINVGFSRAQELLVIIGAADTFRRALIELPPLEPREGDKPEQKAVYQNIFDIAVQAGGRRHAWQFLT